MKRVVFAFTIAAGMIYGFGLAYAAQQGAATKILKVVNQSSIRKVVYKVVNYVNTLAGDPTVGGATLHLQLTPGGLQCFHLPATYWQPFGNGNPIQYRYSDPPSADPRLRAKISQTNAGHFLLFVKARGSAITVIPGNPTNDYDVNFKIANGDDYCGDLGNGMVGPNSALVYHVTQDDGLGCSLAACSPSGAFLDASVDPLQ